MAAANKYEAMLKIDPQRAPIYYDLGILYVRLRDYPKAAAILKRGLRIDPKMQSATGLLGIALYQMGNYAGARHYLDAALVANPQDVEVESYLVEDLVAQDEYELARTHLESLTKREPDNQKVWYLLGTIRLKLARQAFAKIDAIDPNSYLAHEIKGDLLSDMRDYNGAVAQYKIVVQMAPNTAGTHYKLGDAYWKLSDWPDATQEFQAELANNPGDCIAQWKLGNILLEQNSSPEDALAEIDKALGICPNLAPAETDRGRALIRLNRYADALPSLEAAAKAAPDLANVHFLMAQAYRGLGRSEDAQKEMETFSKLDEAARAATAATADQQMKAYEEPPNN